MVRNFFLKGVLPFLLLLKFLLKKETESVNGFFSFALATTEASSLILDSSFLSETEQSVFSCVFRVFFFFLFIHPLY